MLWRLWLAAIGVACVLATLRPIEERPAVDRATCLAISSISIARASACVIGHKDSRVTERVYARFSPTYLRGAASMLEL